MTRSDDHLAALLLAQRLVDASVPPLKASEYWSVIESVQTPSCLLRMNVDEIASSFPVPRETAERITSLMSAASGLAFCVEDLERSGIQVLSSVDDRYPRSLIERLGAKAPPMLYVAGPSDLLSQHLLGIVGSREVDESAADIAKAAASRAVKEGIGVVSGGAKGVDRLAMTAALDSDGRVVGVLAESLLRTVKDSDIRRAILDETLCLCTPYKPTAPFSVANAMGRNRIIYALSRSTFVVSADVDKGGTWAGAVEALRDHIAPVLVWQGPGAGGGNDPLTSRGAKGITEVDQLFPLPSPPRPPDRAGNQLALGV